MKFHDPDQKSGKHVWGILGGMGPLASAEFVHTIYQERPFRPEQEQPIVVLLSDPAMPDRSESFLSRKEHALLERLSERVAQLVSLGATNVIVCCVTIHPLIERLDPALRKKIISLVDVALERVLLSNRKHLLLCTEGTRHTRVFQNHRLWGQARDRIVLPGREDQSRIHQMIYEIKTGEDPLRHVTVLDALLEKYAVDSCVAGCTEIHLLAKARQRTAGSGQAPACIDPLAEIATMICNVTQQVYGPGELAAEEQRSI